MQDIVLITGMIYATYPGDAGYIFHLGVSPLAKWSAWVKLQTIEGCDIPKMKCTAIKMRNAYY
jgi:hypothetical protein